MARSTAPPGAGQPAGEHVLRHILVVGGDHAEWAALGEQRWEDRLTELGKVADHAGAMWLTLRPYAAGPGAPDGPGARAGGGGDAGSGGVVIEHGGEGRGPDRWTSVGGCLVVTSSVADGRRRLVDAVESLRGVDAPITEHSVATLLNAPADADPDLVVVLGSGHRLPPSLVWELAYSELVFVDVAWADLTAVHVEQAVNAFTHRHRRFGGLD